MITFSGSALDLFATRLSEFTDPEIPELNLRDGKTLQNHLLESVVGVYSGKGNSQARHLVSNLVRRIFASIESYERGRESALKYVSGEPNSKVIPYFHALTHFETCVSYSWQVADLICKMSGEKLFKQNERNAWQRLHAIYTHGTKHSFRKYDDQTRPEMPTTIWLTNEGIACITKETLCYTELREAIEANNDLFYDLQKRIHQECGSRRVASSGKITLV